MSSGTYDFEAESRIWIKGESMQDLKNFIEGLNSLTQKQVYDYVKSEKLFAFCKKRNDELQKIVEKYNKHSQKDLEELEKVTKNLEKSTISFFNKLEQTTERESKELYSILRNIEVIEDNFNLESPKDEDMYITIKLYLEMEVGYEYEPYVPATWYNPSEGGLSIESYDVYDETKNKVVDLLKILNMDSSLDYEIDDCDYPDEDIIYDSIMSDY